MSSFNRVTLIGNLTRDPQVKHLPNSLVIAEFGLAMSRRFRTQGGEDREEVCFVDCTAFGKQAQVISEFARKGRQLFIEGRLKYDVWEDKSGHGKRSKLSVVIENFQFLGAREDAAKTTQRTETAELPWKSEQEHSKDKEARFQEADIPF